MSRSCAEIRLTRRALCAGALDSVAAAATRATTHAIIIIVVVVVVSLY
jgi:hypothetical protein